MRLKTVTGREIFKNYNKYLIDWNKKERSQFQTDVKKFLEPYLRLHVCYSEFPVIGTKLKIDIFDASTRIAYEVNGDQHNSFNKFFHGTPFGFLSQIKRDMKKLKFCEINNIKLVEIFLSDLPLTKKFFLEKYDITL